MEATIQPTSGQRVYDWEYNLLGELLRHKPAERPNGSYWTGEYNASGSPRIVGATYPGPGPENPDRGLLMDYDRAGRVVEVRELPDTQRVLKEFVYGTGPAGNGGPRGRLWKAIRHNYDPLTGADTVVEEEYAYAGVAGRVSRRVTRIGGVEYFAQSFDWTDRGAIDVLGYPACQGAGCGAPARDVDYDYDLGFPTSIPGLVTTILYYDNQMPEKIVRANGVEDLWVQDPDQMRRPRRISTAGVIPSTSNFNTGLYEYDGAGNISQIGSDVFVYDPVSRLVSGTVRGGPGPTAGGLQEIDYDAYGNILEMTLTDDIGSDTRTFAIKSVHNRFEDDWAINDDCQETAYDEGDNLTRWALKDHCFSNPAWHWTNEFGYDQLNMMIEHWQGNNPFGNPPVRHHETFFLYTADDERIARVEKGSASTETIWTVRDLEGRVLRTAKETGGSWLWLRDYVWRDGQMLASVDPSGTYHYHVDHLGNPRLVTTTGRAFVRKHDFYPFGEELTAGLAVEDRLRFTGHERDPQGMGGEDEGGDLDYMHARYYSPGIGRFLSIDPDPQSVSLSRPQSWNKYTYVLNNPLVYIDPYGERWFRVDDEWVFFEGTDIIEQITVNEDGTTTSVQVEGLESLVAFDGGLLTLFDSDGSRLLLPATSGDLDAFGNTQPGLQSVRDVGPVPEGQYSFRPGDIQQISFFDNLVGTLSFGRMGAWPGGTVAWGRQRVSLQPAPGTETFGRSGFAIHGGARPGSRGCIDLCSAAPDFFSTVDRTVDKIPVFVDYPGN